MAVYVAEIKPKKLEYDPLAHKIQALLMEEGEAPAQALVRTNRLYRLEGDLKKSEMKKIAESLLTDPVVETFAIHEEGKSPDSKGLQIDVWLKKGVTDPVGETVEKGIRDLGMMGRVSASSAIRYHFPKMAEAQKIKDFASRHLANDLIHDIHLRAGA